VHHPVEHTGRDSSGGSYHGRSLLGSGPQARRLEARRTHDTVAAVGDDGSRQVPIGTRR
jgi:hypothetical protein